MTATLDPQTALGDQSMRDDQTETVAEGTRTGQVDHRGPGTHSGSVDLADPILALLADALDDLERTRIANENRLRQLTRSTEDSDGETRGFGLTEDFPAVARLSGIVEAMAAIEADATKALQKQLQSHPMHPWVKAQKGLGDKQVARLLAAIGDPYWYTQEDRPRLVSELWAYCGYHVAKSGPDSPGAAVTRQRGQKSNWSTTAKMRVYLIAESCIKQSASPYRAVYEAGRARYEGEMHELECKRCGPKGKPAQVGSELSKGHQHARAMRLVSKEILRDLWIEAKRLHQVED